MSGGRRGPGPRPWRALTPERIKNARKALGLKQEEFAALLGRKLRRGIKPYQKDISRWERGVQGPDMPWGPIIYRIVLDVERQQQQRREVAPEQTATAQDPT